MALFKGSSRCAVDQAVVVSYFFLVEETLLYYFELLKWKLRNLEIAHVAVFFLVSWTNHAKYWSSWIARNHVGKWMFPWANLHPTLSVLLKCWHHCPCLLKNRIYWLYAKNLPSKVQLQKSILWLQLVHPTWSFGSLCFGDELRSAKSQSISRTYFSQNFAEAVFGKWISGMRCQMLLTFW